MLFIKSVKIVSPTSKFNGKTVDIIVEKGILKKIGTKLTNDKKYPEIAFKNLHLSPGFVDINAYIGEPGFEQKETVMSAARSAAAGGFTHVCVMPNLSPPSCTKSQIEFLKQKQTPYPTSLLPIGAITHNIEGKDLADIYDMYQAGAVAFSDGYKSLPTAGILERALLYTSNINTLIIQHPEDKSISKNGLMHEGVQSTLLGIPGLPAISELITLSRDLSVLDYTQGRMHFIDISLKSSVDLIAKAKKNKLRVTSSCNVANLLLTDQDVGEYNTLAKVNPPLREKRDITALIKGLKEGTIDAICSQHQPQDEECTKLEFDKADFGMIGFETFFAGCNTALGNHLSIDEIIQLIAVNPRNILQLLVPLIAEGEPADFTLFDPTATWTLKKEDILSKSKNSPFIGYTFKGKVMATVLGDKSFLNFKI